MRFSVASRRSVLARTKELGRRPHAGACGQCWQRAWGVKGLTRRLAQENGHALLKRAELLLRSGHLNLRRSDLLTLLQHVHRVGLAGLELELGQLEEAFVGLDLVRRDGELGPGCDEVVVGRGDLRGQGLALRVDIVLGGLAVVLGGAMTQDVLARDVDAKPHVHSRGGLPVEVRKVDGSHGSAADTASAKLKSEAVERPRGERGVPRCGGQQR